MASRTSRKKSFSETGTFDSFFGRDGFPDRILVRTEGFLELTASEGPDGVQANKAPISSGVRILLFISPLPYLHADVLMQAVLFLHSIFVMPPSLINGGRHTKQ